MKKMDSVREAREIVESFHYPNVVGTALGYKVKNGRRTKRVAVLVFVKKKVPLIQLQSKEIIPEMVITSNGNVKTDVIQTGEFKALGLMSLPEPPLVDFDGPVKSGYSCAHPDVTAGSVGPLGKRKGKRCLVTNAHVGANTNEGKIGDPLYYPGPYDGGMPENTISHLAATVPIEMIESSCPLARIVVAIFNFSAKLFKRRSRLPSAIQEIFNQVDCCAHELMEDIEIDENVPGIGKATGIIEATLGMKVRKLGRTTGYTTGVITALEARLQVSYELHGTALWDDQILSDIKIAGGDSGSSIFEDAGELAVDGVNNLVGLGFAGGEGVTVMNRIQTVFDELDLEEIKERRL